MNSQEMSTSEPLLVAQGPRFVRLFYALLEQLDTGTLHFTAPDGHTIRLIGERPGPTADLQIKDWQAAREILRAADIGLAECFRDGRAETSDLTALLLLCIANERALSRYFYARPQTALWFWLKHLARTNTRRQARRNIQAHYDLSNDFYGLWLDSTMTYSSAVFDGASNPPLDLATAQNAKYERILANLAPRSGAHILEIGCGWGGFAEYAARTRGVRVTGITLSQAQLTYAQQRIVMAGLTRQVDLRLIDYRDITGTFDHIVSIEMFESVGERYWRSYFQAIHERLRCGGTAMLQAITIDEAVFEPYRRSSDFIREYIFPGGMLAPASRIVSEAADARLSAGPVFKFGADYARTLAIWQQHVIAAAASITALGFDEKFLRLWRFYLSYCEASFRSGRTDVIQISLTRN